MKSVFEKNDFMAHSLFILLAGMVDDHPNSRDLLINMILKARERAAKNPEGSMCKFAPPKFSFIAKTYYDLVWWKKENPENVREPPLTMKYLTNELIVSISGPKLDIPAVPVHIQNVERVVQDVSIASGSQVGYSNRYQWLLATFASRAKIRTDFNKKSVQRHPPKVIPTGCSKTQPF